MVSLAIGPYCQVLEGDQKHCQYSCDVLGVHGTPLVNGSMLLLTIPGNRSLALWHKMLSCCIILPIIW